ncbi:hypothetical protein ACFL08_00895 [Patescibacteria group bacterium]
MGKIQKLKKMRKYSKKEGDRIAREFEENFKIEDCIRSCPRFVPNLAWKLLVNFMIKR